MNNSQHIFLVASRGLTATTWFSNALNKHETIFCAHGRDLPGRDIVSPELLKSKKYREDRLQFEQWQRKASIDEYLDTIANADNETVVGNVHGYILPELLDKVSGSSSAPNIVLANMVRNPITILESYASLVVNNFHEYYEKYLFEHLPRAEKNEPVFIKYGLGSMPSVEMQGFVEGCQMVKKMSNDLRHEDIPVILMENIVSDRLYFSSVVKLLTSGACKFSSLLLDHVISSDRLNSHRNKPGKESGDISINLDGVQAKNIWFDWTEIKREIFIDIVGDDELSNFEQLGYDCSFMRG